MTAPSANQTPLQSMHGMVERVTFHSEQTGFFVVRVKVTGHRELITITGSLASISAGEYLECTGTWVNDSQYGLQFKTTECRTVIPTTLEGMEKYLGSGMVKGIGPHFAKRLVSAFGEATFDIIEQTPEHLLTLDGIGKKRKEKITAAWAEQKMVREIMVFLQSHGVGTSRSVRIYKTYGDEAIDKVRENPYRLALDIHGIGFKTADQIAHQLGVDPHSLIRAQAGIRHVLQELSGEGHCAADVLTLLQDAKSLLSVDEPVLYEAIAKELKLKHLVQHQVGGATWLFLTALDHAEQGVANQLHRLLQDLPPWGKLPIDTLLPTIEKNQEIQLSDSQRRAVTHSLQSKVCIITGGPGVGKTTVVNTIIEAITSQPIDIALCAPTGRAAKRLSESTGHKALTIHRLLDFDPQHFGFKHNSDNPLFTDLLVIDEASMVDVVLMNQLLKAVPDHAGVLFVGDVDQLPSVGSGAVLSDLINSKRIPTCHLTEIFRQAQDSAIITNAHAINAGRAPQVSKKGIRSDFFFIQGDSAEAIGSKLLEVVLKRLPSSFGFNPVTDIQVLVPMNRGGLGARNLNSVLQAELNGTAEPKINRFGSVFSPEDKVIQTLNNYDKEVFNGDIGFVESIDTENSELCILFDGRSVTYSFNELDEVSLAYATTIHKSQGSEYPCVVIPLAMQHYTLLERNLLYTGVTRGKQMVVLIGEKKAVAMAARNQRSIQRKTLLQQRLQSYE